MVALNTVAGRNIIKLASKHGLRWIEGEWPYYDEEEDAHTADTAEHLAHELAHLLVAPPSRKELPYFGLGDPHRLGQHRAEISERLVDAEEEIASLLSIGLARQNGLGVESTLNMFDDHGWARERRDKVARRLRQAVFRRHLTPETIAELRRIQARLYAVVKKNRGRPPYRRRRRS